MVYEVDVVRNVAAVVPPAAPAPAAAPVAAPGSPRAATGAVPALVARSPPLVNR